MTLDDRAGRAARNLRAAVREAPLLLEARGVTGPRPSGPRSRLVSFAGAFGAAVLLAGLMLAQIDLFAPRQDVSITDSTFPVPTITTVAVPGTEPAPTSVPVTSTTTPPETTTTVEPADTVAPELTVTYPENGATVTEPVIRFEGVTEPGVAVAAGPYSADVDPDGHWVIALVLRPGGNLATFTATDAAGNQTDAHVSVTYEAPVKEQPPSVEFTAHNIWGSCTLDPPYDEYYGTAPPETKVFVVSEYGSGSAVANGEGRWALKVFFETAPIGLTFDVKVKDEFGNKKYFEFTSLVES